MCNFRYLTKNCIRNVPIICRISSSSSMSNCSYTLKSISNGLMFTNYSTEQFRDIRKANSAYEINSTHKHFFYHITTRRVSWVTRKARNEWSSPPDALTWVHNMQRKNYSPLHKAAVTLSTHKKIELLQTSKHAICYVQWRPQSIITKLKRIVGVS